MAFDARPGDPDLADPLPPSPLAILARWLEEAVAAGDVRNPDAMALATVDAAGEPSVRFVLCRGFDRETGATSFYTGYRSAKARDLGARGVASAVFYWESTERQARLTGPVERAPAAQSDAYWSTRPRLSQIAAAASEQSEPIDARASLLASMEAVANDHGGVDGDVPLARPEHWGGYVIRPRRIELWVGSRGRAHDRGLWQRDDDTGPWRVERLQP